MLSLLPSEMRRFRKALPRLDKMSTNLPNAPDSIGRARDARRARVKVYSRLTPACTCETR